MEVGLASEIPTYSGGLGVLAGDTLRAAADMGVPMVGVTLLHRRGYFAQSLSEDGAQSESSVEWLPEEHFERLVHGPCEVTIEGRTVALQAWQYTITGETGARVPVIFLDTDVEVNDAFDRTLAGSLYGGDRRYRLAQEIVLGVGGRRMLQALGYQQVEKLHMNEGHAALLGLDLFARRRAAGRSREEALTDARGQLVFTTHTPVPAGHDRFDRDLAVQMLGKKVYAHYEDIRGGSQDELNMSLLGIDVSGFVNGVAQKHAEVSRQMFPGVTIHGITNGVHTPSWTSPAMAELFDRWLPGWRTNNALLRWAEKIPLGEIVTAHRAAKLELVDAVNRRVVGDLAEPDLFTIGYARRATAYKRPTLVLRDIPRLRALAERYGRFQIIFCGKAHPRDEQGKHLIAEVHRIRAELKDAVKLLYVPGYNMALGALMTAGVDVWLNTPRAPQEASGTSGMKASHNGVPNLSVVDGWWCEGWIEGVTGWGIEPAAGPEHEADRAEAYRLLELLEQKVFALYHDGGAGVGEGWARMMRSSIALAGSYFNAERMLSEYCAQAYNWSPGQ